MVEHKVDQVFVKKLPNFALRSRQYVCERQSVGPWFNYCIRTHLEHLLGGSCQARLHGAKLNSDETAIEQQSKR